MQLDTLLRSIFNNFKFEGFKIEVLYNTTNQNYEMGYTLLKNKFTNVSFIKESTQKDYFTIKDCNFYNIKKFIKHKKLRTAKTNFRSLLKTLLHEQVEYTMFLTDDSAFYAPVQLEKEIFEWISECPTKRSFSLRLGLEMNHAGAKNIIGKYLTWHFYDPQETSNWSYQFSVDGHIYSNKLICQLADNIYFTNPSFFESLLCNYIKEKHLLEEGRCYTKSVLLSFPINIVQQVANNESLNASIEIMNEKFLEGYIFDYEIPNNIKMFQQYPSTILLKNDNGKVIKLYC